MSHVATITDAAEFDAPASEVWALLMDWAAIIHWMPDGYIQALECEGQGPGAIRHLVTGQGVHLSERLDRADEVTGVLELSMVGPLPWGLISYTAQGKIEALSENRSRLTWRGTLEMPGKGAQFEQVARLLSRSYAKMLQGVARATCSQRKWVEEPQAGAGNRDSSGVPDEKDRAQISEEKNP